MTDANDLRADAEPRAGGPLVPLDRVTRQPIERPPRPGDLTVGWRIATVALWVGVAAALGAVWNASAQLGLATWWLGPRSDAQPLVVRLLPFAPAVLMVLAAINHVRRIAAIGLVAAAAIGVVGIIDIGYVRGLAIVEITIAVAAAVTSAASLTGTYRAAPGTATA